jgi:iron complex transport system ATP-binding protein
LPPAEPDEPLLVCEGLRYSYLGRFPALVDVSLTVRRGERVALLGPNGSGKSTILKAVYRVNRPSAGTVLVDRESVHSLAPRELARRIAVVTQETSVEFDLRVEEMVMLARFAHKGRFEADTDHDHDVVRDALEAVGCRHLVGRSFHALSGGERQLVLVARALAQQADHIVLDEPTNHLDIRHRSDVLDVVAEQGVTVLAALHDLGLAALYCDRVHLLADGRLHSSGTPADVITAENIDAAYGTEVLVVPHPESGVPQLLPRRSSAGKKGRVHAV